MEELLSESQKTSGAIKEPKDFSVRKDVVTKTLLRSIKRYYTSEFDSFCEFSSLEENEKFSRFHELIRNYVMTVMKSTVGLTGEELESTILFFGSIISHIHMRRGLKTSKLRTLVNSVHKCLYNYSHK